MRQRNRLKALLRMKFGPRSYTREQEAFIRRVVAERKPLPAAPIRTQEEIRRNMYGDEN